MSVQVVLPRWRALPRPHRAEPIRTALECARHVLVVGDAGVGRSHLVDVALSALPEPTREVFTVLGTLTDDVPLEVVSPRLAAFLARGDRCDGPAPLVRVEDGERLAPQVAHTLALFARESCIQLVATLGPTAAGRSPWLELWRDDVADRVDVPALDAAEVEELTESVLGGPATTDTYLRLVARTGGNVLLLREVLRAELEAGTLTEHRGVWTSTVEQPPSARVVDVVRRSLETLDPAAREVLDLVALADPLPVHTLPAAVDAAALAGLVESRLVVEQGPTVMDAAPPAFRVHQPLVAEAARALVPLDRRRHLYLALAAEGFGGRLEQCPQTLVRFALWGIDAGLRQDPGLLVGAVRAALLRHGWPDAVRIARAALDGLAPDDPARGELLLLRASAWRWLGDVAHAMTDLTELRRLLERSTSDPRHVGLAVRLTDQLVDLELLEGRDTTRALAQIDRAEQALGDRLTPADALELRVSRLAHQGGAGHFRQSLEPSLELLGDPISRPVLLPLMMPTTYGLAHSGRLGSARDLAELGVQLAVTTPDARRPWLVDDVVVALALTMFWSGDVDGFRDFLELRNGRGGYSRHEVFVQAGRGLLASAEGRWTDAHAELEEAVMRYSASDVRGATTYAAALAAVAAAASGATARARELLAVVAQGVMGVSSVVEADLRLQVLDAGAWLREPTQLSDAVSLARWARERGLLRIELEALHRSVLAAARRAKISFPAGGSVLARILDLAGEVDGARAAALVAHAEAVADADHQLALSRAQELGRLGLWLPGRVAGAGLTRREREIAGLAAGGLSNREIADRFTLSVRTVDTHLGRVFAKLGVHNRRELAEVVRG